VPARLRLWTTAAALLAPALLAAPAAAQQLEPPRPRQGYYISLGAFALVTDTREKGAWLGPWAGGGGAVRFGQLVTRRFGLGMTLELGRAGGDGQTATITGFGPEASFAVAGNLALRGGVGLGLIHLHDPADLFESSTRGVTGARFALGASRDIFLTRGNRSGGLALTPSVQLRLVPGGDTHALVATVGVEVTYWTGLPRNQLELPPGEAWKK
jgi:hypothetical protein